MQPVDRIDCIGRGGDNAAGVREVFQQVIHHRTKNIFLQISIGTFDPQHSQRFQKLRIARFDDHELLGRAFGDDLQAASLHMRLHPRCNALNLIRRFSGLQQFQQVSDVQNAFALLQLFNDFLATFLPLTKTCHPGDDPRTARAPKLQRLKSKFAFASRQLLDGFRFPNARRADQKNALAIRFRKSIGQPLHAVVDMERRNGLLSSFAFLPFPILSVESVGDFRKFVFFFFGRFVFGNVFRRRQADFLSRFDNRNWSVVLQIRKTTNIYQRTGSQQTAFNFFSDLTNEFWVNLSLLHDAQVK